MTTDTQAASMTSELFPLGESLSPKLLWLKKHGILTHFSPELVGGGESPETGRDYFPWICGNDKNGYAEQTGGGHTEEEAIINYCDKTGTPHYSAEDKL